MNFVPRIDLPSRRAHPHEIVFHSHDWLPHKRLLLGVPLVLVEDDRPNAKLMALLLRMEGANVAVAESAEEAMPLIEALRPPLVVLDLALPRMSGLLLVQQIKKETWAGGIAFIAVTAFNGPETKRVALQSGCAGYLRKPVDTETFASFIASHLPSRQGETS